MGQFSILSPYLSPSSGVLKIMEFFLRDFEETDLNISVEMNLLCLETPHAIFLTR